jgi:hypothetical protein
MAKPLPALQCVCFWLQIGISKTGFCLFCVLFILQDVFAQETSLQQIELEGQLISIHYSLNDTTRGRTYVVNLYSSKDNFTSPLRRAVGDVGIEITPGNKKIVLNAREEFGDAFEGKIAFEIRSKVYIPFIKLQSFDKVPRRKRGRPFELLWTGGRPQNILRIDLLKGQTKAASFSNIANSGHAVVTIPPNVKYGEGYRLKIYDPKSIDEIVYSQTFTITRKIPLALKIASVVLVGVAGCSLLINSSNSHSDDIAYFPSAPNK